MSAARDDRLVADIVANIPGVTDPAPVRALLAAWWEHAAREASQGRLVDSRAFITQRQAAGLLELPPALAERVIEREFALLHGNAPAVPLEAAVASVRPGRPTSAARPPAPARAPSAVSAERLEALVGAGLVVVGSLLVGLALLAGEWIDHVPLPDGRDTPLVTPWKAWLAVLGGALGTALAVLGGARRPDRAAVLRRPGVALAGLAVVGLGLLGGSVAVTAVGGVVFGAVGLLAVVTRR